MAAHLGLQILTRQLAWAQSPRHPLSRNSVSLWFDCFQTLFPRVCVGKWGRNLIPACPYPPDPVPSPHSSRLRLALPVCTKMCVFSSGHEQTWVQRRQVACWGHTAHHTSASNLYLLLIPVLASVTHLLSFWYPSLLPYTGRGSRKVL